MSFYDIGIIVTFLVLSLISCLEFGQMLLEAVKAFVADKEPEFESILGINWGFDNDELYIVVYAFMMSLLISIVLSLVWPVPVLAAPIWSALMAVRWFARLNKKLEKLDKKNKK